MCVKEQVQHVFRWGVGNKFRSINANRFTPVHFARPKEVTIRSDYFVSPNESIRFDKLNEQWEVLWYEHQKLNGKPFPVKKFGVEQSKFQAIAFLEELKSTGRFSNNPSPSPPSLNDNSAIGIGEVVWDARMQAWICPSSRKAFGANKHGSLKAKQLAEQSESSTIVVQLQKRLLELLSNRTKKLD